MYDLRLTESLFPAQPDNDVLETTVGGLLRDRAAASGDAMAMVEIDIGGETGRSWTYEALLSDSERLALALATRFAPGDRICVWAPNIPEWLLMEYACGLAGLVLVTANPSYQAAELRYVLEQSRSAALFTIESYRGNPMAEIAAKACDGLPGIREVTDLEDLAALYRVGDRTSVLPDVSPEDAAQIQYTSGTTGFPKGAVLPHRGLTNNARLVAARVGAPDGATWTNFMPMFHTSGCGINALGCVQTASRMLMVKMFDPAQAIELIERERPDVMLAVPTMLVGILEALDQEARDMSSVQVVISGGALVAPELIRRVRDRFGCFYQSVYGQTETSPVVTQSQREDSADDLCHTVGQPLPCTAISIRSTDDNTVAPLDSVGEICVQGYCNMTGYNDNPEATAATIDTDDWLHTGDLGTMDARGYVRVTGRVKEMIIRGGENLFPAEIENVLLEHPGLAEVAVVGLPDDKWGEIVACFLRPEGGAQIDAGELRSYCRQHLSPQKTPSVWVNLTEFPLTGSGKIQKFKLREMYTDGNFADRQIG
jgi:fatty-acyl-CoA synthase